MDVSELVSLLLKNYPQELRDLLCSRDKHPSFFLEYYLFSIMNLIDISPSQGITLVNSPTSLQDLYQALVISQSILSQIATSSFSISLTNSPYFISKIRKLSNFTSKIVSISPVFIKSISNSSTFISNAEYVCRTCCENFTVYNDLTWCTALSMPHKCRAYSLPTVPESVSNALRVNSNCNGTCFDLLEGSVIYKDYQEFVVSDGKNELLVVVQGSLCNTAKIGECIEMTGIYAQRWTQSCDSEYVFICLSFNPKPSSLIKVGVSAFKQQSLKNHDFSIRECIIRSSFTRIYGNYHIKLALILNIIGHLSGLVFSSLFLGDISTGKSTLCKTFNHLFMNETRIINGVLTNPKAFASHKIMNASNGKFENGLLNNEFLLIIDNFQGLTDRKILYKAMEQKSIIAFVESDKEEENEINKNKKLTSEYDRFDVILSMKNYDGNNDFRVKTLGSYAHEDFLNLWDFDTIKSFIQSNLKPASEVKINSEKVKRILEGFITYTVNFNLKNMDMPVASGVSVRLLESLIKICKANAILLGHEEVSVYDAIDALVILKSNDFPDAFVNVETYKIVASEILQDIQNCVGNLDL